MPLQKRHREKMQRWILKLPSLFCLKAQEGLQMPRLVCSALMSSFPPAPAILFLNPAFIYT